MEIPETPRNYPDTAYTELSVAGLLARLQRQNLTLEGELHLAQHDDLTDLPGRQLFLRELERALEGSPGATAVLFFDGDGVKRANDDSEDGHSGGDELIRKTGQGIVRNLRHEDKLTGAPPREKDYVGQIIEYYAARLYADEVAVILHHVSDEAVATNIGLRVQARLAEEGVRVSVGAAVHQPEEVAQTLLNRADRRMYRNKLENLPDLDEEAKVTLLEAAHKLGSIGIDPRDVPKYVDKFALKDQDNES